jgi:hypothetical protein
MSRTDKERKPIVINVRALVLKARKPLTPVGGFHRPEKGGGYNRKQEKERLRREDC